jgi:hypothetical protein
MQGQPISCFYITLTINGNYAGGSMLVTGEMKVCQVIMYFFQYFPWVQQCQPTFYFNSQEIKADSCKKLSELGMSNLSNIKVRTTMNNQMQQGMGMQSGMGMQPGMGSSGNNGGEEYLNIIFSIGGKIVNIQGTRKTKFSELYHKFCTKADVKDKIPTFLLNSRRIEPNDTRTIGELNLQNNSRIDVVLTADVIGAYFY